MTTEQQPCRQELQAAGAHPAPCARHCEATAFHIDLRRLQSENEQLRAGYAAARLEITSLQAQLEAVGAGGVSALMGASQSRPVGAEPVAQWQKRHPNKEYGLWQNTDEGDAKWWRDKAGTPGWEARALYAAPQPAAKALDAKEKRWLEIGKAVERACIELPQWAEVVVSLEKDAGTVKLFDGDGNEYDSYTHGDGLGGVINEAIDAAIAAKQGAKP